MIRKGLSEKEKKRVQPLLQKAYTANGEGFYVYAPKQVGNVKEQLAYIASYIQMDGGDPSVPPQFACEKCGTPYSFPLKPL